MVIGAHAAILYGEPRLTRDIDITVGLGPDQLGQLLDTVREAGLLPAQGAEELARRNYVLPCSDPATGLDVDIILAVSAYEQEAMSRTHALAVGGVRVRYASPEDVLVHKIVAGRPRDVEDARAILAKSVDLDRQYIMKWLREFESTLSSPFVQQFLELERQVRSS